MRAVARALIVVVLVAIAAWLCGEAAPGTNGQRAARAAGLLPADDSAVPVQTRVAIVAEVERAYGLDRSRSARLASFVAGLAVVDLGRSWRDGAPVRGRVGRALGRTLALVCAAFALSLVIGLGAAVVGARRPGRVVDVVLSVAAAVMVAVPAAWTGLVVLRTFAYGAPWRWLPTGGLSSLGAAVLPVATLAVVPGFILARYARAALVEAMREPWATATRARGASEDRVLVRALRAVAAPLTGVCETLVLYLLGAAVVVERVFDIKGMGALVVDASSRGDAPVVIGVTVVSGAVVALMSLLFRWARAWLDPRLRASAGTRAA